MLKWIYIAWRNLHRNATRNLVTGATIALGGLVLVCTLFMADGIAEGIIRNLVAIESGSVLVAYGTDATQLRDPRAFAAMHRRVLADLQRLPNVTGVRSRLKFEGLLVGPQGDAFTLGVKGIEPEREPQLAHYLAPRAGRMFSAQSNGIVLSRQAAAQLHVQVGDGVTILANTWGSQLNALDFTVAEIFENVAPWVDYVAFIPLARARMLYTAQVSNQYLIDTPDLGAARALAAQARTVLQGEPVTVRDYRQAGGFLMGIANANRYTFMGFCGLLFIVVAMGVASLMSITVRERHHELGTMLALGFEGRQLLFLLIAEVLMLAGCATALTAVAASAMFVALSRHGIELQGIAANAFGAARLTPAAHLYQVAITAAVCLCMPLIGAVLPARRVLRLNADDILRNG